MRPIKIVLCCLAIITASLNSFGQDYKAFLEQGMKLYNERQYDSAIKVLKAGLAGSDGNATEELNSWIRKCNDAKEALLAKAKADRERLNVSSKAISFFPAGGVYEVIVDAAGEWHIEVCPEWCSVTTKDNTFSISCTSNSELVGRSGEVLIAMSYLDGNTIKKKRQVISVSQDAREQVMRKVHLVTSPGNATVRFPNDKIEGNSSETFTLGEGEHKAVISKPMYQSKEISINVSPDDNVDLNHIKVDLEPMFSRIKLKIETADGTMISEDDMPSFMVGDQYVDLSPYFTGRGSLSFDTDDDVIFGKLYEGNIIPVSSGIYKIALKAEHFYPFEDIVSIDAMEEKQVSIMLEPHKGVLHVLNGGGADGAKIIVDKKEAGVVPSSISLPKGSHVVEFVKSGYISTKRSYLVDIEDNEASTLNLEMKPYAYVTISTAPSRAEIHLDDDVNFYSPVVNERLTQGIHKYRISKQGFLTQRGELNVMGDSLSVHFDLPEAFPMKIFTEKNADYLIKVFDTDGNLLTEPGATISEPVYLPYGKYKMELANTFAVYNQQGFKLTDDIVYKGTVNFRGQDSIKKLTFSESFLSILGGILYLSGTSFQVSESEKFSSYASANFLKFEAFKGFTTSLLRADAYKSIESADSRYIFSGSCLFLNGELRFGGSLHDNLDICVLGSYKWTPSLDKLDIIKGDYMTGWDWFTGVELSSRIPVLNGSLRLGWQGLNGHYDHRDPSNAKERINTPIDRGAVVMSLNFTLGGLDSKGVGYIRVF